jgi:hypothetical protein
MDKTFVKRFNENKYVLKTSFAEKHPESYLELVRKVITVITDDEHDSPDPERIHCINDGDYQGTLLFVIAATGYQPFDYWYVKVYYGSCSACDTLQGIRKYSDEKPNDSQINDYMTLALHIVQGIKKLR